MTAVPISDMHDYISRRLLSEEVKREFRVAHYGREYPPADKDIDALIGIRLLLEVVNGDPRVFDYLRRRGVVK